jgi:CubicO group peptidase (beta-lactamase class C family)
MHDLYLLSSFYKAFRHRPVIVTTIFVCFIQIVTAQQPARYQGSYQPPLFSDSARIHKMRSAFPIVEKIYREHAEKNHFPGLSFGIVADGKLVYSGSVGFTDEQRKIAVTSKSVFRIASMSKSFTGMAIMQLRDAGKLNLDDPAYKYIPELKNVRYLTSDASPMTVRNLLSHAAGFPEDNPWGDRQLADSDADLLQLITDGVHFSTVPATAFEYSNLGFALAGHIITRVSGKPYQQYINEHILKPLGMNNTYWEYSKVPEGLLAHGYRWINNKWQEETLLHDGSYGAMGGMLTTIEDFQKYMALHLSAWPPSNVTESNVVKRSSIREMHHPWMVAGAFLRTVNSKPCAIVSGYGFGLSYSKDCEGKTTIGHSGGLPGFGSQWVILPEYGIGVVSFANRTYAGTGSVNTRVLDTIIAIAGLTKMKLPVSPILEQRKNELIKLLPEWQNAERSGLFAENFFPDNPIDELRKQARSIYAKAGKVIRVRDMQAENQLRGNFIIEGEKKNILVFFTLTPENPPMIQEYRMREVPKD